MLDEMLNKMADLICLRDNSKMDEYLTLFKDLEKLGMDYSTQKVLLREILKDKVI